MDERGRWVDPPPYEPEARPCGGCRAISKLRKEHEDVNAPGVYVSLVPYKGEPEEE